MKHSQLLFVLFLVLLLTRCQKDNSLPDLNDDFESVENGTPIGWEHFGGEDYMIYLDSTVVHSGKYSVSIELADGKPGFRAWSYALPENYQGKTITLSGYIKTENVTDGFAGLLVRIDPGIGIDNMSQQNVSGTTDWTKYEITLDLNPEETEQILIGGLLAGKGKIWLDDLKVYIDKPGASTKEEEKVLVPADKDDEFDEGSKITDIPMEEENITQLKTLGLVWGFLKYYHPAIAEGNYNWDYELFRILPKYLETKDGAERDALLVNWIEGLGKLTAGEQLKTNPEEVKIEPDLNWINNSNFSKELAGLLTEVKNAERPWKHYYIQLAANIGNPVFNNEKPYEYMSYPDAGYRLLSLYRYWNIIQYYFPYKNLIEEDWKVVLEEFIPKFTKAKDETSYTLAALELIGRIHDTHANIWSGSDALTAFKGNRYAAPEVVFTEEQAVVTGFHDEGLGKKTGLQVGDVITNVNDEPVEELVKERLKYNPASNYPTKLRDIGIGLLRTNDTTINVTYLRNNTSQKATLKTYNSDEMTLSYRFYAKDSSFRMINEDIAYINNGNLKTDHLPVIWDEIESTKGLIIDNRNYPSDFPIFSLSNYLMPEFTPFVKFSNGSLEHPGLFTYTNPIGVGSDNPEYYKGKVVVLVNEISQSSSEYHAMAYQVHPNATVIGSTTAAADGNVSSFYLPGGISTMISGIGVYYLDGTETQRIGIALDIEVKPTIEGIKAGRDEVLEKAIEVISEE